MPTIKLINVWFAMNEVKWNEMFFKQRRTTTRKNEQEKDKIQNLNNKRVNIIQLSI